MDISRAKWSIGVALLAVATVSLSATGLEVEEFIWGFDGKVLHQRVVPLSVLLSNPTSDAFQGVVKLSKRDPAGGRLGSELVVPVFVSPFSMRWVQFYAYVSNNYHPWALVWGFGADDRLQLDPPAAGAPAVVYVRAADSILDAGAGLKSFPEELFPTSVSATDALHAVVLDHVPRWEPARREAFIDWVRRGGIVHVARGRTGECPEFAAELAVLNAPEDVVSVGAGCVVRHEAEGRHLGAKALGDAGFAAPEVSQGENAMVHQFDTSTFQALGALVSPNHNWSVIYVLAVIYIILVGPVNFLIGRDHRGAYWKAMAFFLVTVFGCGFALNMIGRRGYGEASRVHSVTYARWIGDEEYDSTQWLNVFATQGDQYQIQHASEHSIYSTCQDAETVNGVIRNGRDGGFAVDIPVYSRRAFLHRAKLTGIPPAWRIEEWEARKQGEFQKIRVSGSRDLLAGVREAHAFFRGHFYKVSVHSDAVECSGPGGDVSTFCNVNQLQQFSYAQYMGRHQAKKSEDDVFRSLCRPLVLWATGGNEYFSQRIISPEPAGDRLHLFLYADTPESFCASTDQFGAEVGRTLYHFILRRPES